MIDLSAIASKWQKKWAQDRIFEAKPDKRKKFFLNFPYPYINAYQHIGHLFTLMRVEAFARYKRMRGFNVLFPQGWHATGSPIIQAAKRVKDREPKQIKIMQDMGFSEQDLVKFERPEYWIEFFAPEFKKDYNSIGMSIDWRREFYTTSLNPRYDKFIKWQFRKLKEKGYVIKGKFPVVWDPKENVPVGDHDRVEGEGETPQEYLLVKHKLNDGKFLISATLRPDTILGITNLFVHPDIEYKEASINGEKWILGEKAIQRLQEQDHDIKITGSVKGRELIGKHTEEFGNVHVPILPATFLDPNFGTGLVHSVPSDSADDLIALRDIQKNEGLCKEFKLNVDEIQAIEPIPILDTPEYGHIAAQTLIDKYKITSQKQRKQLEAIKKELYKISHHTATFNDKYKTGFSENLAGKKVEEGKDIIKQDLIDQGWALPYYELTGKVVSRSLAECIVKIVSDQWFIDYGNKEWKQLAHDCLNQLKLYPEKSRQQFEYVIDWLHEWACTREEGLGTRLPWDEKWLIESLSDSTIYLAYYTIAHIIKDIPEDQIDDNLFDYVLLGDEPPLACKKELADQMRAEFNYWYPVDFRNSGKDLIQNHLTFFIFNHTAIFPKEKWPAGIGTNGWVTVDGQKMSKSLGNMVPVRDVAKKYGPDACRITILAGGEGMDDPNWETQMAASLQGKFDALLTVCKEHYGKGRADAKNIDAWMESRLNTIIKETTKAMDETMFRTAIQKIFFELQRELKYYLKRTDNQPNKKVITRVIDAQLLMLAPFTPHICEEIWHELGKKDYISIASWPETDKSKINANAEASEALYGTIRSDIRSVMKLAQVETPKKLTLFIAQEWKFNLVNKLRESTKETQNPGEILKKIMTTDLKKYGKEITNIVPKFAKDPSALPAADVSRKKEQSILVELLPILKKEFGTEMVTIKEEDSKEQKAKQAMPGKVAIILE